MESPTWTPGEWRATRSIPQEGYDCWWITACPAPNMEKEIATVAGGHPEERHEANARLIAAAPSLYAALVTLRYTVAVAFGSIADADVPESHVECIRAALADAHDAIRLAEVSPSKR